MERVPKIVGERLKAAAVVVDHPDPNVLTAFCERSLPDRERSQVLEHLARCGECRDVIALALPAEEPAITLVRPVRGRWLTWPQLRWGLVAAGVLVVGSFGVLRYRASSHPETVASYDASRTQDIEKAKDQTEPLPATPAAAVDEEKKAPQNGLLDSEVRSSPAPQAKEFDRLEQFAKLQPPARDQRPDADGSRGRLRPQTLAHGPKAAPTQQWQQNVTANANNNAYAFQSQTPAPTVPPEFARKQLSNQVVVSAPAPAPSTAGAAIGGPTDKKVQDVDTLAMNGRSLTAPQTGGANAGAEVARAKPAEAMPSANATKPQLTDAYAVSSVNGSNFSQTAALAPESARWSINAMGSLQRSLDQGKSWQDVDVIGAVGITSGANMPMAMKSSREKALAKDKAELKQAHVVFRAVSANGPDVWAGGSSGHLYHSTDAGGHWVQVVPTWAGVVLTADIVSLQFTDPLQGRIVTSSSEIWTTPDAGQTWQKH
jgi:Putative zinc-finger